MTSDVVPGSLVFVVVVVVVPTMNGATSSYVDLVGLKVFSSVELSRT
jgi:hypothetical protein